MAEVTTLQPSQGAMDQPQDLVGSEVYPATARTSAPAPNPEFTFPMLPPAENLKVSDFPETEGFAAKKPSHRTRPSNISISPLPPFSFPGSSPGMTPPSAVSGEPSPSRGIPIPSRSTGHRRGGSEFIGGDGSMAGPGLMSTSPTKGEDILPSPPVAARRRGHAHRRSGAVSNHDLSSMLKPGQDGKGARGGSAPGSPVDFSNHRRFMPSLDHSASQPTLKKSTFGDQTPTTSPSQSPQQSPQRTPGKSSQPRPRVGFSDRIEFIPRPLSTISSETSSSLSTIRASHSLTGSISSVISTGTSSPPSAKKRQHTADALREYRYGDNRPRTADSPPQGSPSVSLFQREMTPPSRPASAGTDQHPKNDYFGDLNGAESVGDDGNSPTSPGSLAESNESAPLASPQFEADLQRLRGAQATRVLTSSDRPRSSPEAKVSKKHKKVKTWAGSLLSRKEKTKSMEVLGSSDTQKAKLSEFASMDEFSLDDVNFDEDTSCVIKSPDYQAPTSARSINAAPWASSSEQEADGPDSLLDLDAAFNAPDEKESPGKSQPGKRVLHSSGATGGFVGPGMHYHRRAESAPSLSPVMNSVLHRFGSNSQMADVFEEEEDDEASPKEAKTKTHSPRPSDETALQGLGVQIVDSDSEGTPKPLQRQGRRSPPPTDQPDSLDSSTRPDQTLDLTTPETFYETADIPVEVVDAVEEPRFSVVTKSSDGSTVTPTFPDQLTSLAPAQVPTALDFASGGQRQTLDSPTTASSAASPDVASISFDAPRLRTAASSITDRSTWSSARQSDIKPAMSCSTEDVPSLTSSASTMISGQPAQLSPSLPSRPSAERSHSLSAAIPRRTRPVSASKRSSLASLSRLVSGSYGERSKLSLESYIPDDSDKSDKKKRHRISRLMKFWKSKEKLSMSEG